jgi:hypothetical protein
MGEELLGLANDNGSLRIKLDSGIVSSLDRSLRRTAPFDLKVLLFIQHKASCALKQVNHGVQVAWKAIQTLSGKPEFLKCKDKLKSHQIKSERIKDCLDLWSAKCGFLSKRLDWAGDAEAVIDRFEREEKSNLQNKEWDEITKAIWSGVPKGMARIVVAGSVLMALAAAAWFTLDPIVTGPVVIKIGSLVITLPELLGVAGLGAASHLLTAKLQSKNAVSRLARLQVSNLYAIVCDRVGLPREIPEGRDQDFPAPSIIRSMKRDSFGIKGQKWESAMINTDAITELRKTIKNI